MSNRRNIEGQSVSSLAAGCASNCRSRRSTGGGTVSSGVINSPHRASNCPSDMLLSSSESGTASSRPHRTGASQGNIPGASSQTIPTATRATSVCRQWADSEARNCCPSSLRCCVFHATRWPRKVETTNVT